MQNTPLRAIFFRQTGNFAALLFIFFLGMPTYAHEEENHGQTLTIEGAWAPHTGKRTHSAAIYFTITNNGSEQDTLTGVETPAAGSATLHQSKEVDGIMQMDHVPMLAIPAGATVNLRPGSYHIMLMRLVAPLKRGDIFPLSLSFEHAGAVTITVEVTGIGGPG